jgi:DNA processing protein
VLEISYDKDRIIAESKAKQIIDDCSVKQIAIFSLLDPQYPPRLRSIKDAPPIIYVLGSHPAILVDGGAVVGTRNASATGQRVARRIAETLTFFDLSTISGLALGIDAAAHAGALDAKGKTVAVLAHGLDTVAPKSNQKLAERILTSGGALISEHPPGVPPRPPEFVRRNRIQSGMAMFSVVVESGEVGGSMHQARFTKEQGRHIRGPPGCFPEARVGLQLERWRTSCA